MKDVYPTLFRLSSHKNAIVVDVWGKGGRGWRWILGGFFWKTLPRLGVKGGVSVFGTHHFFKSARRGRHFNLEK